METKQKRKLLVNVKKVGKLRDQCEQKKLKVQNESIIMKNLVIKMDNIHIQVKNSLALVKLKQRFLMQSEKATKKKFIFKSYF